MGQQTTDASALYAAITARRATRSFERRPLSDAHAAALDALCATMSQKHAGVRFALVRGLPEKAFRGVVAGYGKISGASDVVVMIGSGTDATTQLHLGRCGEMVLLGAVSLGLGTCWSTGSYRQSVVRDPAQLRPGERLIAVSPVGYRSPTSVGDELTRRVLASHKRRPLAELLLPNSAALMTLDGWVLRALEVARLAPSAMNRQPWRFTPADSSVTVSVARGPSLGVSRVLDCGIASAHLELAATAFGLGGSWTDSVTRPEVCRYSVG